MALSCCCCSQLLLLQLFQGNTTLPTRQRSLGAPFGGYLGPKLHVGPLEQVVIGIQLKALCQNLG